MRNKAFRRFNEELRKRDVVKRKYYYHDEYSPTQIGRYAHTPKVCSCYMCGNPRKYYGNSRNAKTIQELRGVDN